MSSNARQVLCGPFSSTDLVGYQAAILHSQAHFETVLTTTARQMVQFIINCSVRLNRRHAKIPFRLFSRGVPCNPASGFAGVNPIINVTDRTLRNARNELIDLGILSYDGERYTIDYSVTLIDLVQHETVIKRLIHENRRGGMLSTLDGILQWALSVTRACLPRPKPVEAEPEAVEPVETDNTKETKDNRDGTYTFLYKNYTLSPAKAGSRTLGEFLMNKAEELKASILGAVQEQRTGLDNKRRSRATLADLCSLFEKSWMEGQRLREARTPPTRFTQKDRALLKSQIIIPFRSSDIDLEGFAKWCGQYWSPIGAQYFQKSKAYPEHPAFSWFVKCLETYNLAYQHRDTLDPSGVPNTANRVSSAALAATKADAAEALAIARRQIADLQAQVKSANAEAIQLKGVKGLPLDDDPVYDRAIRAAHKKIVIGSYDDEPAPSIKKKPRRLRKC